MFTRYILTFLSFCLVASLHSQTITVNFDVDYSVGRGNKLVTVSYCANGAFDSEDGSDDWGAQWLTIGFVPGTGIVAALPSTQITGFANDWLPFADAFGASGGQVNSFTPSQVGGTDDGNVYIAFQVPSGTPNQALADGACQNIFSFLLPLENGNGAIDEMFLLDETGLPGSAFAFQPNILINGVGDNVYDGVGPISSLTIKLLRFNAAKSGNDVELSWLSTSKINGSHFEVERSQDFIKWTKLGMSKASDYTFTDFNVIKPKESQKSFHYRLKMQNSNGSQHYSAIKSILFEQNNSIVFDVYPNPTQGNISINLSGVHSNVKKAVLKIYDSQSQLIKTSVLELNIANIINMSDFRNGIYLFVVIQEGKIYKEKIIKLN